LADIGHDAISPWAERALPGGVAVGVGDERPWFACDLSSERNKTGQAIQYTQISHFLQLGKPSKSALLTKWRRVARGNQGNRKKQDMQPAWNYIRLRVSAAH